MGQVKVRTGMQVEIELVDQSGSTEHQAFVIVPDKLADYAHGLLGESTPLAQAVMGHAAGEELPYRLDELVSLRILSISPFSASSTSQAAEQRTAEFRKALADLDKRNAAAFAASFSGKWGDYDPDGVEKWDERLKPDQK